MVTHVASTSAEVSISYPVNMLRNKGLDLVTTSHVLMLDVDFIPSVRLAEHIRSVLLNSQDKDILKNAIVVPAFERKEISQQGLLNTHNTSGSFSSMVSMPRTTQDLKACYDTKECIAFQSDVNWEGHFSTQSDTWIKNAVESDDSDWSMRRIECFHSHRYEPYVVIPWCPLKGGKARDEGASHDETLSTPELSVPLSPYYDERFYGYGKNKIQLISHLRALGYMFHVLPRGFITHHPHPESKVKRTWNNNGKFDLHQKMDSLYPSFLNELATKYGGVSVTPICKRAS